MLPVRTFAVRIAATISLASLSVSAGYGQMLPGGSGGAWPGALGGLESTGAHQGHILTGPGATGIPLNYIRGAAPGMSLLPRQAPSGAFHHGYYSFPAARSEPILGITPRRTSGGVPMGRGVGPAPLGGDKNPAQILLEGIDGRRRGTRAAPSPGRDPRERNGSRPASTFKRSQAPAVYFAERGAYEDRVYRTNRGGYRQRWRLDRPVR